MSHIKIDKREFNELVGENITDRKLNDEASFLGVHWNQEEGPEWDVEVYPNRPDLLSVEGLSRAYRGFFGLEKGLDEYQVKKGSINVNIDESVEKVRPYIGCAVVRDIELSKKKINGLIQLQEKLHLTMGRRREKLAIGLHDLSNIEPDFTYKAVEPEEVSFTPLEYDREMGLGEILDEHDKGRKYSWILEDEDKYPVIVDSKDKVLSFPPIINNQLTEVGPETRDIFIDVTGKHRETVMKALNILVTALAERGGDIESVTVGDEKMPSLQPEEMVLEPGYFRNVSGLDLEVKEIIELLESMKYGARKKGGKIRVKVPAYRIDVMHQYDLIEDVVIAEGYDNIEPELPNVDQIAEVASETRISDQVKDILMRAGALETNTHALSSKEKLFDKMERDEQEVVELKNALTEDFSVLRNWLSPSLMAALRENRHRAYPQSFFAIDDVGIKTDNSTGSKNVRKLAYVTAGSEKDFNDAKAVLQVVERDLGIQFNYRKTGKSYFKSSRAAQIIYQDERIGHIGEYSEKVCENWDIDENAAGFEINLEKLVSE